MDGIEWTIVKDMSNYLPLLQQPQKLIFDLGNLVDSIYTGTYNVTLTATYFTTEDTIEHADLIVPVSARQSANDAASVFSLPSQNATNELTLPRNIRKAVFSLSATGQIDEEFWYSNVLSSDVDTFGVGNLLGYSPFREVQVLIDGHLAGVAWPFPVIFTGGVVPGLWRPIVGIDAFDLREDEIDISPWLPLLCDGAPHNFEIRVAGINDNDKGSARLTETVGSYWLVTGKIFMWLDPDGSITTGTKPAVSAPVPSIALTQSVGTDRNGTNETLSYTVKLTRRLSISSTLNTWGNQRQTSWQQQLTYSNEDHISNYGSDQLTIQDTRGYDHASIGYSRRIGYPITLNSSFSQDAISGNFTIFATLQRGQTIQIKGQPVFPTGLQSFVGLQNEWSLDPSYLGSSLVTTQNGTATYEAFPAAKSSVSFGNTKQDMVFSGIRFGAPSSASYFPGISDSTEIYHRYVAAVNGSVTEDDESLIGRPSGGDRGPLGGAARGSQHVFAAPPARNMLGRSPGVH